ncbi:hypothetical protein [Enterococcus pallens]|uniref:Preprotein translocase subunit SecB n=1 Tax=Enterococcus pallens ATCC BAA-351 TaxID=1158607 RepID=R2RTM9_9ENTE|nr:hypothetical protein [Enterococcus pallens]EOH86680.1 hypothetical protein UAU_05125 [Enterococcus pallens ATCC BAA-351]EOU18476.1 hypothetical protein I588_03470 [Enterococcus pallens ATCC BAA-351]
MLKEITNISLKQFSIEDKEVINDSDNIKLTIIGESNLNKLVQFSEDKNVYSTNVWFKMAVLEQKLTEEETKNFDDSDSRLYVSLNCIFKVDFVYEGLDINDEVSKNNLAKEVGRYTGPYIREVVANMFNRTLFPVPPIPLEFFDELEVVE